MDIFNRDEKCLKQRKIQVPCVSKKKSLKNNKHSQRIDNITKQLDKKVNTHEECSILIHNNSPKKETNSIDLSLIKTSGSPMNGSNSNKQTTNNKKSRISIRKLEDLCATPKKNIAFEHLETIENIKTESTNRPQVFSPSNVSTNLTEFLSKNVKVLQETPVKRENDVQPVYNNDTPNNYRKRKLSMDINGYDQLLDVIKSELDDNDLNGMEPIDMLHDLSSMMDFEDCKITPEYFCSTGNNTMYNEESIEVSEDQEVSSEIDPLSILDDDKDNIILGTTDNQEIIKNTKSSPRAQRKRQSNNQTNTKGNINKSKEYNLSEEDSSYDFMKNILGELDIDLHLTKNTKCGLPPNELKRLYDLEIELKHDVPPQHKIEHTAGSKPLTKEEKKEFLKLGPIKTGPFTPSEDKIIMANWKMFCEVHNWNPKFVTPFLKTKNGNIFYMRSVRERQKFSQFLANGLPWRTLRSIYYRFRYLYGNRKNRIQRYTAEEDNKILSLMNNKENNTKFLALSKMLGRSRHSVWLRYQRLKKVIEGDDEPSYHVIWTLPLIEKFVKTFMDITLCEKVIDLKDAVFPKAVWQKLGKKLQINYDVLKTFWLQQLHMQLFCPERIYLNDIKIKLIEYVYGKGFENSREIVWSNVAKYFEGFTTIFLCKAFFSLVQDAVNRLCTKNFLDIMEYLYNKKRLDIRNDSSDKFLPRLSYSNEKMKIIDKDDDISV